jgi:site-specific DNA recombinase
MKVVEFSPSPKSKDAQAKLLERLSPAWMRERKVPLMAPTSLRQRKRAGVYLRYSTDQQDPYSFERQLEKANAYAEVIGVDIVKVYGDPGASGAYTANRPSYNEMMEDAKQGKFDILIIEEGDRLSRKLHITTTAFATLGQYGVEIHSTKHGKWSLIHAAFSGLLSDEQRTRITELMLSGRVKILNRGLWPAQAPYGFEKIPHQPGDMRHREDQATIVKRIVHMRLSGVRRHRIADVLARQGVPPPGKEWSGQVIRRILTNPLYVGILIFFRSEQTPIQVDLDTIKVPKKMRPADQWTVSERPDWRLIDPDDWRKLQELEVSKEYGPCAKFLLSQLAYCGQCGRTMVISGERYNETARLRCSHYAKVRYYREREPQCSTPTILMNSLEEAAIRFVCEKLDTSDALKQMQAAYEEKAKEQAKVMNHEREKLKAERDSILARLDATFEAAMTVGLTTEVVRKQRENFCARVEAIEIKLASLPEVSIAKAAEMAPPPDSASFLSELTPMRDYRECGESLAQLMAKFRTLMGRLEVRYDRSSNEVIVRVHGPISHVSGDTFRYQPETRSKSWIKRTNNLAKKKLHALTDEEWTKIQEALPVEPIWIEEFDEPLDFRKVLDGIIFCKKCKIGWTNLPVAFGPRRQVWAAARMLNYAGILDAVEDLMKKEELAIIRGISLRLDSTRSMRPDPWGRFLEWNKRRKERVLARQAIQQAAE